MRGAEKAKAPLHEACLILGNESPQGARRSVQAWLDHPEILEIDFKDWGNRNTWEIKGSEFGEHSTLF